MNPFLDEDEDSIPLKTRNYSNYNNNTHKFMDDNKDNNNIHNSNQNDDDNYGTFDALKPMKSEPPKHKSQIKKPNSANKLSQANQSSKTQSTPIRTDKHTGNRYRRLRSIPIDENAPESVLNYEKEVYSSLV